MRVYKFLEAKWALECIRKQRLKIGLIPELNDPWEGRAISFEKAEQETAWDFIHGGMSILTGMLCFSKSWDNPLLWSHYSKDHSGIALGFDIPDPDIIKKNSVTQVVVYVENPKFFPFIPIDPAAARETLIDAFKTKFIAWNYEHEVRCFFSLGETDKKSGLFFKPLGDIIKLREIIFGVRHSNFSEKAECAAFARQDKSVTCKVAAMSKNEFKMIEDNSMFFQFREKK